MKREGATSFNKERLTETGRNAPSPDFKDSPKLLKINQKKKTPRHNFSSWARPLHSVGVNMRPAFVRRRRDGNVMEMQQGLAKVMAPSGIH